jgi:hypothetical protein
MASSEGRVGGILRPLVSAMADHAEEPEVRSILQGEHVMAQRKLEGRRSREENRRERWHPLTFACMMRRPLSEVRRNGVRRRLNDGEVSWEMIDGRESLRVASRL